MRDIFRDTMKILVPYNPAETLDRYLEVTEWFMLEEVRRWPGEKDARRRELGAEWLKILNRQVKWKMVYEHTERLGDDAGALTFVGGKQFEERIRRHLPPALAGLPFSVDVAQQDTRPLNPMRDLVKPINIFNPATGVVSPLPLANLLRDVPPKLARYRVFALDHEHDQELAKAAELAFGTGGDAAISTNT
jgi:hypothetical protein